MRQPLVRSYAVTHPAGTFRPPQSPDWHQLVHAEAGAIRLTTPAGSWVLPPDRAAWVAAGTDHSCTVRHRTVVRTLYLHRATGRPPLDDPVGVLELSGLARAMLLRLVARAPIHDDDPSLPAWLTVLREEVQHVAVEPLRVPMPRDPLLQAAAARVMADVGHGWTVQALAACAGTSRRTLERRWREDVSLSVAQWITRARLVTALERLAAGEPVGVVAHEVGYASHSAFGVMFRAHLGASPTDYLGPA